MSAKITTSGHRGLDMDEPLIFEQGATGRTGVDLADPPDVASPLDGLVRSRPIGLPGLSEPQVVRHYTRLSQKNYAIDSGLYPLGSCTMKHNPRINEVIAQLPGIADVHPHQPEHHLQGLLSIYHEMQHMLEICSGMDQVTLQPVAGAQGEFTAVRCVQEYFQTTR